MPRAPSAASTEAPEAVPCTQDSAGAHNWLAKHADNLGKRSTFVLPTELTA